MWKLIFCLLVSTSLFAQLTLVKEGDIFIGTEIYNHGDTGKRCSVEILEVEPHLSKGIHCSKLKVKYNFQTKQNKQPESTETIYSSRSFWRDGVVSCASLVNAEDDQDKAFGQDTTELFNEMFSGSNGGIWNKSSYFMVFDKDKLPLEALMSNVRPTIERTWTCVNLKLEQR